MSRLARHPSSLHGATFKEEGFFGKDVRDFCCDFRKPRMYDARPRRQQGVLAGQPAPFFPEHGYAGVGLLRLRLGAVRTSLLY